MQDGNSGQHGDNAQKPAGGPPRRRRGYSLVCALVAVVAAGTGAGAALGLTRDGSTYTGVSSHDVPTPPRASNAGTTSEGTGIIISPDGLILTDNHVINGESSVRATLAGSGRTYTARVLGYDAIADVALLQLEGVSGLPAVPIGSSSRLTVM